VNGIAKAGEGKAELILGNENIENKVIAQLKRALQPALTNVSIKKKGELGGEEGGDPREVGGNREDGDDHDMRGGMSV
jgi:hypothetical protein